MGPKEHIFPFDAVVPANGGKEKRELCVAKRERDFAWGWNELDSK